MKAEDFVKVDPIKVAQEASEKEIVWNFAEKSIEPLREILGVKELRVYSFEFPMEYKEEKGRVDLILEIVNDGNVYDKKNPLLVFEFKKNRIRYGPIDQLLFYMKSVGGKLYRPNVQGYLAAPEFSFHEIEEARKSNCHCLQFDNKGNIRLLC